MDELNVERPGARYLGGGRTSFEIWAPRHESVLLAVGDLEPAPMERGERGYWRLETVAGPGDRYAFVLGDGKAYPDPASLAEPDGVHGRSMVVDTAFEWGDAGWRGLELDDYAIYELHVGAFTSEGTFDAVVPRLDALRELGVTALELMPIAQFPGRGNWGYDGTYPYAAQHSYGGVAGLQRLVDACHQRGIAVLLDVVYNHLGPEGNYAPAFGHYFSDDYHTPWGAALNFDGPGSDEVRRFFVASAVYWVRECHIDGFRLDAIHAIKDAGTAVPFLEELAHYVHREGERQGRRVHLFGETSKNDPRYIEPVDRGGMGLDAQWNDDFHHCLHALLTGERQGYYVDFGRPEHLARCISEGYTYQGQWSAYFGRRQGRDSGHIEPQRLVAFSQNHDQVGNRARSDRLAASLSPEKLRLAAAATILSPYLPLLFMGEEYGEVAPFWYFVDHGDPGLLAAVQTGRAKEFERFDFEGEIADPGAASTFEQSRLDPDHAATPEAESYRRYYAELLRLRREVPGLRRPTRQSVAAHHQGDVVLVARSQGDHSALLVLNFGGATHVQMEPAGGGRWVSIFDSAASVWGGRGKVATMDADGRTMSIEAESAVLLERRSGP